MAEVETAGNVKQGKDPSEKMGSGDESLASVMWKRAAERGENDFLHVRSGDGWKSITWKQFASDVKKLSRALIGYGIEPGDRVAILSNTRYEWTVCDYALLSVAAITVPIYQTSSPQEVEYILENSGTRLVLFEDQEQLEKLEHAKPKLDKAELFVRIDGNGVTGDDVEAIDDFLERGSSIQESEVQNRVQNVGADDVCTYIYTSGTTGPPKGCVITHRNFESCVSSVLRLMPKLFNDKDSNLLFLPLAHGFARMVQFVCVDAGMQIYYGDIKELSAELKSAKPTFFISVPRMFEKAYSGVQSKAASSPVGRAVFAIADAICEQVSKAKQEGKGVPLHLKVPYLLADKLIYSKVREGLGGKVVYAISGGAPLATHVAHFFNAAGITILEGYGLTETAPASTVNTPSHYRIGTVGQVLDVNEVKIAEDGEVLMKGDNIFSGYYGEEAKTAEAIENGWFHSGDIGEFDSDGYLKITGRKKDLIITAGGKNITPTLIEDKLKQSRFISQAVVIGDNKPYLVALITLDDDELKEEDRAEVERQVSNHVIEANNNFGRVEQVKKFKILDHDFTIDDGEITPTLKVKRANIQKLHKDEIEKLYNG